MAPFDVGFPSVCNATAAIAFFSLYRRITSFSNEADSFHWMGLTWSTPTSAIQCVYVQLANGSSLLSKQRLEKEGERYKKD